MHPIDLNLRDEGTGRPVVFVHGVGSDLTSWSGVIDHLPPWIRSIRYDLRGHGGSPQVPGPYSIELFVEDLMSVLDRLELPAVDLVGFSLGGLIAQEAAVGHGDRVRSLCLISTVNDRTPEEQEKVDARAATLSEQGANAHLEAAVERWFSDAFRARRPDIVEERLRRSRENNPQCYAAAYRVLADADLRHRAAGINRPSLIMTGEEDQGSTPRMAAALHRKIAGSELVILKGLRHSVLLESPETVATHIREFLGKVPA